MNNPAFIRNIQRTPDMIHMHELFRLKAFSYKHIWCFHYHLLSLPLSLYYSSYFCFGYFSMAYNIIEWNRKRFIILFIYTLIYSFHSFRPASRFSLYLWSITCFFMTSNTRVRKMELIIGKKGRGSSVRHGIRTRCEQMNSLYYTRSGNLKIIFNFFHTLIGKILTTI